MKCKVCGKKVKKACINPESCTKNYNSIAGKQAKQRGNLFMRIFNGFIKK